MLAALLVLGFIAGAAVGHYFFSKNFPPRDTEDAVMTTAFSILCGLGGALGFIALPLLLPFIIIFGAIYLITVHNMDENHD